MIDSFSAKLLENFTQLFNANPSPPKLFLPEDCPIEIYKWFFHNCRNISRLALGEGYITSIEEETLAVKALLGSDVHVIFDVGANVGLYTKSLLTKYPHVKVHLFEPLKAHVSLLREAFGEKGNVFINQVCIGQDEGIRTMFFDNAISPTATLYPVDDEAQYKLEVNQITLFNYFKLNCIDCLDLLKIDAEGSELDILKSLDTHLKSVNLVQFEIGRNSLKSGSDLALV